MRQPKRQHLLSSIGDIYCMQGVTLKEIREILDVTQLRACHCEAKA